MNIIESLKWRYATKKFDPNHILSIAQVNTLKQAFNLTATSFGLQPIKLVIISNKTLQKQLLEHAYNQLQVKNASHLLVLCIDADITNTDIDARFDLEKNIRGTSEEIVAPFRKIVKDSFASKSVKNKQFSAITQAYIALGNLMTVCAVEKIDSCPMEGFNHDKFDEILNLATFNLKSILLLPVGKRSKDDFMQSLKKVRKPIAQIIIEL